MEKPLIDRLADLKETLRDLYAEGTQGLSIADLFVVEDAIEYIAEKEYGFKA